MYVEPKPCLQCGKPFTRRWAHEMTKAKFCGNACKLTYQQTHPTRHVPEAWDTRICETCGKEFRHLISVGLGRYCSLACKHRGQSRTMTGRRYVAQYKSKHSFRNTVRKQFHDRCAVCGWNKASCDVAHIDARKDGGPDDVSNVVILCPNCHRLYDRNLLSRDEVIAARPNCVKSA